jgi:pimeloyl-ACP methyl ester carboxylesterase
LFQQIALPSGERLALDVTAPRGPDGTTFVYVHGLGSHRRGEKALFLDRELTRAGCGFARVDLRGHGESGGRFAELTLTRQIEDLSAVLAHLGSGAAGTPPRRLLLIGASLGALTVAWHGVVAPPPKTGEPAIAAQVLIAPAFRIIERYLDALGESGRARWEREGVYRFVGPWFEFDLRWDAVLDARRHPHDRLLRETRRPTLLLHGSDDSSAPLRYSQEFAERCTGTRPRLVAIEGGDHRLTAHKQRLLDEIVAFHSQVSKGELACAS